MSACSAILGPVGLARQNPQASQGSDSPLEKFEAVRGDVESAGMTYTFQADVLLHRNLVIDVLKDVCDGHVIFT